MPDQQTTAPATSEAPTTAYSAAEALKYAEEHPLDLAPNEEDEALESAGTEPEEKTGAEVEEDDAEEEVPAEEEEGADEPESEDDEDEIPQLDPLIEELAKGNPKAEKRVQEIARGLQKLKTEAKELKTELESARPQAKSFQDWSDALNDRNTAARALEQLVLSVAQHHQIRPETLFPTFLKGEEIRAMLPEQDEFGRQREVWEREGYASAKERELDMALRAMQGELQTFRSEREQLRKEREETRKAAEFTNFVNEATPKTIRKLEKLENGWKVTQQMVEKALTEFPQLKDDPARAVKAAFPDELKKHYAYISALKKPRGPEMPSDARGRGEQMPEPRRFSAADAFRMVSGR